MRGRGERRWRARPRSRNRRYNYFQDKEQLVTEPTSNSRKSSIGSDPHTADQELPAAAIRETRTGRRRRHPCATASSGEVSSGTSPTISPTGHASRSRVRPTRPTLRQAITTRPHHTRGRQASRASRLAGRIPIIIDEAGSAPGRPNTGPGSSTSYAPAIEKGPRDLDRWTADTRTNALPDPRNGGDPTTPHRSALLTPANFRMSRHDGERAVSSCEQELS